MTLPELLQAEMERRGWSQTDLAREMDVSPSQVSRWLRRDYPSAPRLESLLRLASVTLRGLPPAERARSERWLTRELAQQAAAGDAWDGPAVMEA